MSLNLEPDSPSSSTAIVNLSVGLKGVYLVERGVRVCGSVSLSDVRNGKVSISAHSWRYSMQNLAVSVQGSLRSDV